MNSSSLIAIVWFLVLTAIAGAEDRGDRPIDRAQKEVDRGTGRIVDPQTHELDQIEGRDRRETEKFLAERDRQEQVDKQQKAKTAAGATTQPAQGARNAPLRGAEGAAADEPGAGKVSLAAELLAAVDKHDQAMNQARDQIKDELARKKRELALEDEFTRTLLAILNRYDIRRLRPPTTGPVIPTTTRSR